MKTFLQRLVRLAMPEGLFTTQRHTTVDSNFGGNKGRSVSEGWPKLWLS
jgi:hypothetical protein